MGGQGDHTFTHVQPIRSRANTEAADTGVGAPPAASSSVPVDTGVGAPLAASSSVPVDTGVGAPPAAPPVECKTCVHPVHSWATMPVSFHSARDASKARGEFTPADMATIAKFPLVTIEKWQGSLATDASNRSVFLWEEDAM